MFGRSAGAELVVAKVKLEFLEKENSDLKLQVQRLQEALIAKTSPVAYSNLIAERLDAHTPIVKNPLQEDVELLGKYLNHLADKPIFSNANEFINYIKGKEELESNLEQVVTAPPTSEGLYNEE